jgi:RNA-directed DNA polymerase
MTVEELAPALKEPWPRVKQARWAGTDQPQPGKRVEVPNPPGGSRKRGVPTVVDRCIQDAVRPGLQAPGDPPFAAARFGFRPGRTAHQAVKRVQAYRNEGDPWGVDRDLEKVCDRGNHDQGRREVSTRVRDRRVWTLLQRVLKAGARERAARQETGDGGPQGGPRSPLRSNLLRDRRDREVERRGPRFVRDAEDRNVEGRSNRAGSRG